MTRPPTPRPSSYLTPLPDSCRGPRVSAGQQPGQLHLNAFLMSTGHHEASWRLPESDSLAGTDVQHFQRLAQTAERGKFDSIFFADSPVLHGNVGQRPYSSLEPTVLLAAIAAVTERIGLIATASTTYNEPYNLARRFASVDHISGGRAGWNVVTTAGDAAARNFSLPDQPAHSQRYERAAEFLDVATQALGQLGGRRRRRRTREPGSGATTPASTPVNHAGTYFQVEGALDVPRSAQGHPVIVQAGSSEDGKDFAARYAEAVFTAQQTLPDAQRLLCRPETADRGRPAGTRRPSRSCRASFRSSAPPRPKPGGWSRSSTS